MVWSPPRTWTTGEIVTAAMMNSDVRDNGQFLFNNALEHSRQNDLSDITLYTGSASDGNNFTLFDVTGEGHILGGIIAGFDCTGIDLVIDGNTNGLSPESYQDLAGDASDILFIPPVKFASDASLLVGTGTSTTLVTGYCWIKQ